MFVMSIKYHLSAYEVKNDYCLFLRFLKIKTNGVFLFEISFFVLELFRFLYYANKKSDDVINRSTKRFFKLMGGAVAKWLVHWTPDRAVRVRALAGALCCVLGQDTLLS